MVLDTGISDTWAFSTATQCVGTIGDGGEDAEGGGDGLCVFGTLFQGDCPLINFGNMHFSTNYWGNQTVNGTLGLIDVTVGGLRVTSPPDYAFYTIISDDWLFEDAVLEDRKVAHSIDSGTPFICVPTSKPVPTALSTSQLITTRRLQSLDSYFNTHADTANYIADAYVPPAKYNATYGVYFVDCDAITQDVAVVINGIPFLAQP